MGSNYEYAVVASQSGATLDTQRTPQIDDALYQELLAKMANQGFEPAAWSRRAAYSQRAARNENTA